MSFIFGGNTEMSYEDIQRKRAAADRVAASLGDTPRNVGEGLHAIGKALMVRGIEKRTSRREGELKAKAEETWGRIGPILAGLSGGGTPSQPLGSYTPAVTTTNLENQDVADDTMRALGKEPLGIPAEVKAGIFQGESGGDYDAVFGYQQRPGGKFEGVSPTNMKVGEVLQFQDPSGPYGQYVKGQVGRVATPVGAYQVVGKTLREAVKAGVVSPDEQFTPEVQDRVGAWIYKTQGTGAWEGYKGPGSGGGGGGVTPGRIDAMAAITEALSDPYIRQDPGRMMILQAVLGQQLAPPKEQYSMVRGSDLGMSGEMANAMFNRSPDGRITQIGGGGTKVTVNNQPGGVPADEEELRKNLAKKEGELWGTYLEQGGVSAGTMQDMQLIDELITMAPQGPIQGRLAAAFPGANSAADAFQSVVKRVAPTLRAPGSGSTSDIEYDGMLKALPQLSARPEANAAIAGMMKAKAQINIRRAEIVAAYQSGQMKVADARRALGELDKQSIMTPELQAVLSGLSTESGSQSDDGGGWTDNGDGTRIRSK